MRFKEFNIQESTRGLLFRAIGDPFKSATHPDKVYTFAGSQVFPEPVAGKGAIKYPDQETLDKKIKAVNLKFPGIVWTNTPTKNMLAFAIVTLTDEATKKNYYFGRYFQEITPNMAGKWKNDGIPGFSLDIKSSKKSKSGLKPKDLVPVGQQFKNPSSIIESLSPNLDPEIKKGMDMLLQNQLPIFKVDPSLETAIRDDLGEIIAPIALWQGMIMEDAEEARKFILKKTPWSACSIIFSASKNAGLVDSLLRPPKGLTVGVSSKGAQGAKASASNIWSGVELLKSNKQENVLNEYPEAVHVLEVIKTETAYNGPVVLGTEYGYCTRNDGLLISRAITSGIKKVPKTPEWKNIRNLMAHFSPKDMDKPNYNIGYHALAGLAKMVQDHVNSKIPNFSEACLTFLNSSPLLQIHMYTKASPKGVAVTGFKTIWPPKFTGTLKLNAGKSYYATGVINKFAFGF